MKNLKKLLFLLKYKRVPEKAELECEGCVIFKTDEKYNCYNSYRAKRCMNTKTILVKRSFKLFTLLAGIILFASCTTYNNCIIIQDKIVVPDTLQTEKYLFDF